jgi:glycosyltransferase involved in cell wall biosynthesis
MNPNISNPLVSIFIITHNRSKLLPNAILSALNQTYSPIEVIVIDDYSTDNTTQTVTQLQEEYKNLHYFKLSKPSGANAARNQGILHANGYFVTGLDDDDAMTPDRIEKLVKNYRDDYAYVCSQVSYVFPDKTEKKRLKFFGDTITFSDMLYANISGNQVLTTKEMFIQAGLYDEKLVAAQDYDMWLKLLSLKPKAKLVRESLMLVDRNDAVGRISSSKKHIKGYFEVYKKYKSHMTKDHRRFQLFKLLMAKNKPISTKGFIRHFSYKNIVLYLYLALKLKARHVAQ